MRRCLIINADDLGFTHGINRAVGLCAAAGTLPSATVMANGEAFEDAVAIAKGTPRLSVGVHLVLTGMPPLSHPEDIPGLADRDGRLPAGPLALLRGLNSGKISRRAIRRELELQVVKVLDHGIVPTHLDSHKHVHCLPMVFEAVAAVASRYSIRRVRNPFDAASARDLFPEVSDGAKATFLKQHLQAGLIGCFRPTFHRIAKEAGLRTPDHFFGVSITGLWNEALLRRLMRLVPPGLSEWMLHPGLCDGELLRSGSRLRESREAERDLLLSPLFKKLLQENRITLVDYGEESL